MKRIMIVAACGTLLIAGCADLKRARLNNVRGMEGVSPGTNYLDHNHDGQPDTMTIGISQTEAELHIRYGTNWVKVYSGPGVRIPTNSQGHPWTRPFKDITSTEYTFLNGQWIECPTGHEMEEWEPERTNHGTAYRRPLVEAFARRKIDTTLLIGVPYCVRNKNERDL